MANIDDFQSDGTAFNFSKGPKSIYYGLGDEDVFGVVLNVPQTDDDDEWGGTERIALERVVDQVADLTIDVKDPANSGANGLLNRMSAFEDIVTKDGSGDITSLTIGDITLDGATNTISVGVCGQLTTDTLRLGNEGFVIDRVNPSVYKADYKRVQLEFRDDGSSPSIDLLVNTTRYRFTPDELQLPSGTNIVAADVTVCGDLNSVNGNFSGEIAVDGDVSMGGDLTVDGTIRAGALFSETNTFFCAAVNVVSSVFVGNELYVGSNAEIGGDLTVDGTVRAGALFSETNAFFCAAVNVVNSLYVGGDLFLENDLELGGALIAGALISQTNTFFCSSVNITQDLFLGSELYVGTTLEVGGTSTFNSLIYTKSLAPKTNNTYDVGLTVLGYRNLYLSDPTGDVWKVSINASGNLEIVAV